MFNDVVERATAEAVKEFKEKKQRITVRGLFERSTQIMGLTELERRYAQRRYIVDYRTPIGVSVPEYVANLCYQVSLDWNNEEGFKI